MMDQEADRLPKSPSQKIIRADEESAWRDGYSFLAEAERVHAIEAAKGFAVGKAAGETEASVLVANTAAKIDRHLASLEPQLATLALDIVRRILDDFDDAELVARAVRTALNEFRKSKAVIIRAHPSAEAALTAMIAELQQSSDWKALTITVEPAAGLDERACIIATDFAVIEATVETQLAAIAQAIQAQTLGSTL